MINQNILVVKNLLISILILFSSTFIFAQKLEFSAPEYKEIEKNIKDENSPYFYQRLLDRVEAWDTTLTTEHYRHLYFGQVFMDNYNPYSTDSDEALSKYYQSESLSDKEMDEFIVLALENLKKNPVNIRVINFLSYIYHLKGNEEMAMNVAMRFHGTFSAIMSSGDGKTCETAYHVLYISHEYVFLNVFEFQMESQSLINDKKHNCDYLQFIKDSRGIEGIYFNIDKPFSTLLK